MKWELKLISPEPIVAATPSDVVDESSPLTPRLLKLLYDAHDVDPLKLPPSRDPRLISEYHPRPDPTNVTLTDPVTPTFILTKLLNVPLEP